MERRKLGQSDFRHGACLEELEPLRFPTPEEETADAEAAEENENLKTGSVVEGDEEGTPVQLSLFDE